MVSGSLQATTFNHFAFSLLKWKMRVRTTLWGRVLADTEVLMSEWENCEILKQDVENLADLLLKLRLKVSQIGVDVNRAATKCVASTEFVTAVGNTLDDIGSL